jgi:hypothetical protein
MPASHEASFFKVFFAPWPIVYFGRFFWKLLSEVAHIFGLNGWAAFLATFSQTHLVTLPQVYQIMQKYIAYVYM